MPFVFCAPTAQVRNADIVVSAAGRAGLVKGHWIRPGAMVVDVAMNTPGDNSMVGGAALRIVSVKIELYVLDFLVSVLFFPPITFVFS